MYQNYVFDLYGTLVDIHTDESAPLLWQKLSVFYGYYGAYYTPEELQHAYLQEERVLREQALEKEEDVKNSYPEIALEYVFQILFQRKGVQISMETAKLTGQFFRITSLSYIKLYPNIIPMFETLKQHNKKIYLLSNAQQIFTEYEMNYLGIKKYFDGILFSSDAGYRKPDKRLYERAVEQFSISVKESVMIGNDSICDMEGAKAAGFHTFYVHTKISPFMPEHLPDGKWMYNMDGKELLKRLQ